MEALLECLLSCHYWREACADAHDRTACLCRYAAAFAYAGIALAKVFH